MALLDRIHRSRRFALFALTREALKVIVCFFELRAQSPFGFSPPNYPAASSLQTSLSCRRGAMSCRLRRSISEQLLLRAGVPTENSQASRAHSLAKLLANTCRFLHTLRARKLTPSLWMEAHFILSRQSLVSRNDEGSVSRTKHGSNAQK